MNGKLPVKRQPKKQSRLSVVQRGWLKVQLKLKMFVAG